MRESFVHVHSSASGLRTFWLTFLNFHSMAPSGALKLCDSCPFCFLLSGFGFAWLSLSWLLAHGPMLRIFLTLPWSVLCHNSSLIPDLLIFLDVWTYILLKYFLKILLFLKINHFHSYGRMFFIGAHTGALSIVWDYLYGPHVCRLKECTDYLQSTIPSLSLGNENAKCTNLFMHFLIYSWYFFNITLIK